jgi:uncharacterized protein (TIGR03086 family)
MTTETTPRTTINDWPFGDDDPRALFAKAVMTATEAIGAVRPDQLDQPTPCTDMDVRTLLEHMVGVLDRVAVLGRGEDPFTVPPAAGMTDAGWREAWLAAAHRVQDAWADDAALERTIRLPWAEMSGAVTLVSYAEEVTVHTWDLARATGQSPAWDDDVVAASLDLMRRLLPAEHRAEAFAASKQALPAELRSVGDPFGEAVPVPDGAPAIDRLVAWTGRRP